MPQYSGMVEFRHASSSVGGSQALRRRLRWNPRHTVFAAAITAMSQEAVDCYRTVESGTQTRTAPYIWPASQHLRRSREIRLQQVRQEYSAGPAPMGA